MSSRTLTVLCVLVACWFLVVLIFSLAGMGTVAGIIAATCCTAVAFGASALFGRWGP